MGDVYTSFCAHQSIIVLCMRCVYANVSMTTYERAIKATEEFCLGTVKNRPCTRVDL